MPNPTHSDLDSLKAKAELIKNQKKALKFLEEDNDSARAGDTLIILHKDEVATLEDLILDILGGEPISLTKEKKKHLVSIFKHVKSGDE